MAAVPEVTKPARVQGIDVARGIASMLMVQGHAFDAWTSPEARETTWYAIERVFLQTLALPAFLVLAGASLALRVEAAAVKGERAADVRRAVLSRALQIVVVGYALNAFSAIVDGSEGIVTWLRADVLHVIGLSLASLALAIRGERVRAEVVTRVAIGIAIVPIVICPWVTRWSRTVEGPIGWVLGLFADVPGITRMPWIPLASWAAIGFLVARAMIVRNRDVRSAAGAPTSFVIAMGVTASVVIVAGTWAQHALVDALGGPLDRAHVAVIANAVQLVARGILVLAVGALIAPRLPERVRWAVVVMGQGSLWAYAFHVPLCYGRFAEVSRLREGLSIGACALAATLLVIASWGAAGLKRIKDRRWANS
ncbi:acyltransferase family protein [Sandaracinus amylolyticus]|uniref:acyltransferase family protein n=1 Tax=Sandaracinus amylolyticus TaxID=927083 RepID=UPI0012EE080A|nr:acyltransferase family protein [Sandaracinus amylolyticus]